MAVFLVRLFYLQIIKHDYYKKVALAAQMKEHEIQAERGEISAHDSKSIVPLVLNETRYTLFADPKFVTDPAKQAVAIASIIGGNANDIAKKLVFPSRYVVLAKKLPKDQKVRLDQLNFKGIGTRDEPERTYPEGSLAAQLLGFVNDNGQGEYGIEQYLNSQLAGKPGELKAITDAQGVPLAASRDNVVTQPQPGEQAVLTIDISMQKQLEDILKTGLDNARSTSGSALILDPNNGAVKAMANYPTYDPSQFYNVSDTSVFNNAAVSSPLEVGSVMKPLTMASALNQGVISKDTTYYDPSHWTVDGQTITNIEEDGGAGIKSLADILQLSLNTGATWMLMQMGGGQINQKARDVWHDYMVNHYNFGSPTGIEQGYEASGSVPDPDHGFGLNIQYANTAFGQGMTATPMQMGAGLAGIINGGTYFQPHLLEQTIDDNGKARFIEPKVLHQNVVSNLTSQTIQQLMEYVVTKNYQLYGMKQLRSEFNIGGKTGTAEITKPGGGYYNDRYNGMFIGFVGGDKPQYVIVVRVNEPKIAGYAGSHAAAPIFSTISDMLINNFGVTPKSK